MFLWSDVLLVPITELERGVILLNVTRTTQLRKANSSKSHCEADHIFPSHLTQLVF